jgi:glucosamine--fructose-6-phosphate aminotransferase (isomerizing)
MTPMQPSVMVEHVRDFPRLLREHVAPFDGLVRAVLTPLECLSVRRVVLTGDGDSFHAAHAAELAFEQIAGVACEPLSAQRFLDYGVDWLPVPAPHSSLVVGISASGRTQRVVQCLERARQRGAFTVAVTGTPGSPVTAAAERHLALALPDLGRSPGLRTYIANLLGLLLLAIRIGEIQGRYHQEAANDMRRELAGLAPTVAATIEAADGPARAAADAFSDAPVMAFVGSGPSYGTALFSAAKVVEAAGVLAVGQDLEEWSHVERFAYPRDMPMFVVAPPGRSHWRAVELAALARDLGRRVAAVVRAGDEEIARSADRVFPVAGDVREEFTPLVYHIGADLFAAFLAERLGRLPFQASAPAQQRA